MNELKFGSRLKKLRQINNLTLEEVGDKASCTKGYISQLERDLVAPSVVTLKHILDVYGESMSDFFENMNSKNKKVFSKVDRKLIRDTKSFRHELLAPKTKYLEMEPEMLTVKQGKAIQRVVEDTEIFGFISKGKVLFKTQEEEKMMSNGDCFYLFSGDKLDITNLSETDSQIVIVTY